jgi:DNA polymerase-1
MQRIGIRPDLQHFANLSGRLQGEIEGLQSQLERVVGTRGFNANSGDQVADYLYGTLGLDPGRETKDSGRGSTDKKYLKALEYEHPEYPQIGQIRTYRELYKLKHSFVDVVPDLIKGWPHDGRIHVAFRTTSIPSGRLAASMPEGFPKYNMLAQPKRGPYANEFNQGWVADEGHVLCEWDESQIELRAGAHLSQDPYMLAVYRGEVRNPDGSHIDLHAGLAHRIFGVYKKDQTDAQRVSAKEINFGFWMGQTAVGLVVSLRKNGVDIGEDDAQKWMDEANRTYAGAQPYKDRMIAEAERNGFVRCLSGRIRYIGGIRSKDERVRAEAQRFAFSTPVQEAAQFVMKQAEASLYEDVLVPLWRQGRWVEPILQIHDAIRMECERKLARDLHTMVSEVMTHVEHGLSVPLEVEGKWGYNLGPVKAKGDASWVNPEGMRSF